MWLTSGKQHGRHTDPGFTVRGGPGLPGFALRDVGVVVLDVPVLIDRYAELPRPGLADTLGNQAGVGYASRVDIASVVEWVESFTG